MEISHDTFKKANNKVLQRCWSVCGDVQSGLRFCCSQTDEDSFFLLKPIYIWAPIWEKGPSGILAVFV